MQVMSDGGSGSSSFPPADGKKPRGDILESYAPKPQNAGEGSTSTKGGSKPEGGVSISPSTGKPESRG